MKYGSAQDHKAGLLTIVSNWDNIYRVHKITKHAWADPPGDAGSRAPLFSRLCPLNLGLKPRPDDLPGDAYRSVFRRHKIHPKRTLGEGVMVNLSPSRKTPSFLSLARRGEGLNDDGQFPKQVLERNKVDAARFAYFWNEIVKNLREEDYIANLVGKIYEDIRGSITKRRINVEVDMNKLPLVIQKVTALMDMFNKWKAQRLWGENYERIMELYNVQIFNKQTLIIPERSEDGPNEILISAADKGLTFFRIHQCCITTIRAKLSTITQSDILDVSYLQTVGHCYSDRPLHILDSEVGVTIELDSEAGIAIDRLIWYGLSHVMPLLEIVRSQKTSSQVIVDFFDVGKKIKKTPVVVRNCTGFAINRTLFPCTQAALLLVEYGADIYCIDIAFAKVGMAMGPFRLCDLIGFNVAMATCRIMELTSENVYGTVSSAIMKLPNTNYVAAVLFRIYVADVMLKGDDVQQNAGTVFPPE
ncbi:hypothetical protein FXO37_10413 [Capsicum annuum]|nr:hypothetical protein FXO37_10413 [Capsicum annuum]